MNELESTKTPNHDPLTCSPESLRGHIVNTHFRADLRGWYGVADWDYGVAQVRGIPMHWVVKKACHLITLPDLILMDELLQYEAKYRKFQDKFATFEKLGWDYLDPNAHRKILVKNLHAMERRGLLGEFDWGPIEVFVPRAKNMPLDLTMDTSERPFSVETLLTQSETKEIKIHPQPR